MRSIGERLRSEREAQGLSLSHVANQLRISSRYLQAIEEGDMQSLPGGFFYRAFVRQYAQALHIEESQFEKELEELRPPSSASTNAVTEREERFPIEVPPLSAPGRSRDSLRKVPIPLTILIVVVIACSGLYSLWYKMRTEIKETTAASRSVEVPAPVAAPVQRSEPVVPAPVEIPPAPVETAPAPAPTAPTVALPANAPGPRFQVSINATEDAWVSLASAGKTLYVGILKAGASTSMEGAGAMRMIVGNAGGVEVKINGKATGPIGPRGQPRTVMLTPEGVQAMVPVKKPATDSGQPQPAPADPNPSTD
jgi:cytoskeleton protein RodZ